MIYWHGVSYFLSNGCYMTMYSVLCISNWFIVLNQWLTHFTVKIIILCSVGGCLYHYCYLLHKKYLIYHVIFYQKIELSFLPLWINAMFWFFHKVLKHSSCWCNREVRKQTYLQNWKWNHNLSQHITLLDPHHSLSLPIPPNHRKRTYISINVTNIFQAVSFKVLNWLNSGHVVTPKYMTYPWVRFKMSDINLLHTMVSCW